MSVHVMSWVLRHSEAKLGARLVLISLAEFAHDDGGRAFPSVETLTERTRLSRRGVQDALRRLEQESMIVNEGVTRSGTAIYRVVMGGAESAPPRNSSLEGAQISTRGGEVAAPNPSKDPLEGQEKDSPVAALEIFEHWRGRMERGPNTLFTPERQRSVRARQAEGYTVDRIKRAIDGCAGSDFHMGRHEKTRGRPQNDLTLICRNGSKLEAFEAMDPPGGGERSAYDRVDN